MLIKNNEAKEMFHPSGSGTGMTFRDSGGETQGVGVCEGYSTLACVCEAVASPKLT